MYSNFGAFLVSDVCCGPFCLVRSAKKMQTFILQLVNWFDVFTVNDAADNC
jgi:hypothetical protein